MSVWGEIKYAINSTLGTSNFKALNELFDLYCGVKGSTNSNDVLDTLVSGPLFHNTPISRKIKMTGQITVYMSSNLRDNVQVYVNNEYVGTLYNSSNVAAAVSINVTVKYGDIIKILANKSNIDNTYITLRGTTFFAPMGGIIENV